MATTLGSATGMERPDTGHQDNAPRNISTTELEGKAARWVSLNVIDWEDQEGTRRKWEVASRKTTGSGGIDAVDIVALLRSTKEGASEPLSTILIEQYRPPTSRITIEFPAGLIDGDETPETAAERELEEETGFKAAGVLDSSPLLWSDPGMTTATMKTVILDVPVSSVYDEMPLQHLDKGEYIVRRIVPLDDLYSTIQEYAAKGCAIDARLSHFAIAWSLSRKIAAGTAPFSASSSSA